MKRILSTFIMCSMLMTAIVPAHAVEGGIFGILTEVAGEFVKDMLATPVQNQPAPVAQQTAPLAANQATSNDNSAPVAVAKQPVKLEDIINNKKAQAIVGATITAVAIGLALWQTFARVRAAKEQVASAVVNAPAPVAVASEQASANQVATVAVETQSAQTVAPATVAAATQPVAQPAQSLIDMRGFFNGLMATTFDYAKKSVAPIVKRTMSDTVAYLDTATQSAPAQAIEQKK